MGNLSAPAKVFFSESANDLCNFTLSRNFISVATYTGLPYNDDHGHYIGFLVTDNPRIIPGDFLIHGKNKLFITEIDYDKYQGQKEIMKAYY